MACQRELRQGLRHLGGLTIAAGIEFLWACSPKNIGACNET